MREQKRAKDDTAFKKDRAKEQVKIRDTKRAKDDTALKKMKLN